MRVHNHSIPPSLTSCIIGLVPCRSCGPIVWTGNSTTPYRSTPGFRSHKHGPKPLERENSKGHPLLAEARKRDLGRKPPLFFRENIRQQQAAQCEIRCQGLRTPFEIQLPSCRRRGAAEEPCRRRYSNSAVEIWVPSMASLEPTTQRVLDIDSSTAASRCVFKVLMRFLWGWSRGREK